MPPRKRAKPESIRIPRPIMNDRIRDTELLVIDENGEKIGIISREEALRKAEAVELDLILVAGKVKPPVAKILDYGKWQYEQKKAATKNKSAGKALAMKGIRLGVRIGPGDLEVRRKSAEKFLSKGHKVKVVLQFRGREMAHQDLGFEKLKEFAAILEDVAKIDDQPKKSGRQITMILGPKK